MTIFYEKNCKKTAASGHVLWQCYRFANYKEKMIDLLMRVTTVSVETVTVVDVLKTTSR